MVDSCPILHSSQQDQVDAALLPLLPKLPPFNQKEAFPAAAGDMPSIAQQLDSQIAPHGQ